MAPAVEAATHHAMWSLLWHLRGSFAIDATISTAAALDRIEGLLKRQRKPVTKRGADSIIFDAPLWSDFFGPNWLAMVIYDQGRIWVDQESPVRSVHYDLRSLHGFVFCLVAAAMPFVFGTVFGNPLFGLKIALFALVWLYGMNVLLALLRVLRLIRRAVRVG
jgi:hypothetical protein